MKRKGRDILSYFTSNEKRLESEDSNSVDQGFLIGGPRAKSDPAEDSIRPASKNRSGNFFYSTFRSIKLKMEETNLF